MTIKLNSLHYIYISWVFKLRFSVNKAVDDGKSGSDGYSTDPGSREGVSDSLR